MTISLLPLAPEGVTALSEFLAGVERRAAVLAELLCGDADEGDAAVASAMLGFRNAVARRPLGDWDMHFWRLLLATGQLRGTVGKGQWPTPLARLAALGVGTRAVLLLRLLAGLDEAQAAAALGVTPAIVARASQKAGLRAGPRAAHAELEAAMQQHLRHMSRARLEALARHRERALRVAQGAGRHWWQALPRRRAALAAGVVVGAIALASVFLFYGSVDRGHGARPLPLPPASPRDTFDADFALMTHRDFEQLASPDDDAFQRDVGFYAWYAAQTAPATDVAARSQAVPTDIASAVRHGAR